MKQETIYLIEKEAEKYSPNDDVVMVITTTEESQQELRRECFKDGMIYALTNPEILASEGLVKQEWILVSERLPTIDNQFDVYICEDCFGYGTICGWDDFNKKWYPKICAENIQFNSDNIQRYMDYTVISKTTKVISEYKELSEKDILEEDNSGSVGRFIG